MLPSTLKTEPERSGDPLFGLLVGCYLALLATAPVVYAAVELGVRDGGALYGTVLVTLTVVAGSGDDPTVLHATIDPEKVEARREEFPALRDRR